MYTGMSISAEDFLTLAEAHNVWHLAQHAISNAQFPEQSRLLFPSENESTEALSALRLLTAAPPADLAVLGACYSGDGAWQAGEGALSLAYMLRQAEVQSVVSNQWAVADQFSGKLLTEFHIKARDGATLSSALSQAQLHYLDQLKTPAAAHPFYWSGFQLLGNAAALA